MEYTSATAVAFLGVLPGIALLSCLALACGGTGFLRLHLVLAAAASTGAVWALAAWKAVFGRDLLRAPLAWACIRLGVAPLPADDVEFGILVAPFLFLAALGCYALATIGFNLYRFNDCEEASEELTRVRGTALVALTGACKGASPLSLASLFLSSHLSSPFLPFPLLAPTAGRCCHAQEAQSHGLQGQLDTKLRVYDIVTERSTIEIRFHRTELGS